LPSPSGGATNPLSPLVASNDFWENDLNFGGPAAAPGAFGQSIKGVNIWKTGLCSQELRIGQLASAITTSLQQSSLHRACALDLGAVFPFVNAGYAYLEIRQLNLTATSGEHTAGFPTENWGGFLLNANMRLGATDNSVPGGLPDCNLSTTYHYTLGLSGTDDGLISITGVKQAAFQADNVRLCTDTMGLSGIVQNALGTELPNTVNGSVAALQAFTLWNANDGARHVELRPDERRSVRTLSRYRVAGSSS
jgi:hypothetical protein